MLSCPILSLENVPVLHSGSALSSFQHGSYRSIVPASHLKATPKKLHLLEAESKGSKKNFFFLIGGRIDWARGPSPSLHFVPEPKACQSEFH